MSSILSRTMEEERVYLPECWDDDERMGYLFSGFRENRQLNPRDWDNKLKFWSELVMNLGRTEKCLAFSVEYLSQKFRRNGVIPKCIDGVVREMQRGGQLVRMDDLKANGSWVSWGMNAVIHRPLRWAFSAFQHPNVQLQGEFVAPELLKEFGEAVLSRHHSRLQSGDTDHVVEYASFREECVDLCKDETTFDLILFHLQRRKEALVTMDDNTKVIKFAAKGQKSVSPVTSTELGTLRLRKTITSMQVTIERLSSSMQQGEQEARQYLRKGMKSSAKSALRRKKLAQKKLENSEATLETLQQLHDRLHSAESEKMVMEAYRSGAQALRKTFVDNGLTPEAMEETISDIQEVMEMCNEIDDTLVQGNKSIDDTVNLGADIDADSLESELASLLKGDGDVSMASPSKDNRSSVSADASSMSAAMLDLPEVPTESPAELDSSNHGDSIQRTLLAS